MRHCPHRTSQHRANKQRWSENTARVARSVTGGNGEKFQNHQQHHQLERHPSVQSVADKPITDAQHLRHKPTHQPDQQPARHRLQPNRFLRKSQEACPDAQQELRKGHRNHAPGHAQHCIHRELRWMHQLILWNLEQRIIAKRHAQNHPRRRRGQHHRAHHRCVQIAHNFLEREQHRGQRRIKRGCNRRRRSHRNQFLHLLAAQS